MDISEILKRKQPRTRTIRVLLDDSLQAERDELIFAIKRAEISENLHGGDWSSPVAGLRAKLSDLDQSIIDQTAVFTFMAIPRPDWSALVAEHVGDEDEEVSEEFMIAVVAASSIDADTREPNMSLEQAEAMWAQWGAAETDQLYLTAFAANREVRSIPFIEADTDPTVSIGSNSTTATETDDS